MGDQTVYACSFTIHRFLSFTHLVLFFFMSYLILNVGNQLVRINNMKNTKKFQKKVNKGEPILIGCYLN